jgi:hypothetical protein
VFHWYSESLSAPRKIFSRSSGTLAMTAPFLRHKEQLQRLRSSIPFSSSTSNSTAPQ